MGCCNKKQSYEAANENHKLVEENKRNITVLLTYAEDYPAVVEKIKEIEELVKYMGPSTNKEAAKYDNKISEKIGDIKIALNKGGTDCEDKCISLIKKLKIDVVERLAISK